MADELVEEDKSFLTGRCTIVEEEKAFRQDDAA
jgi:hypothetical protein